MALCASAVAGPPPWGQVPSHSSHQRAPLQGSHVHRAAAWAGAQHTQLPPSAALQAAEPMPSAGRASVTNPRRSGMSSGLAEEAGRSDATPVGKEMALFKLASGSPLRVHMLIANLDYLHLPILRGQLECSPHLPLPLPGNSLVRDSFPSPGGVGESEGSPTCVRAPPARAEHLMTGSGGRAWSPGLACSLLLTPGPASQVIGCLCWVRKSTRHQGTWTGCWFCP